VIADLPFKEIWAVDFEFVTAPGDRPTPMCLVGRELISGKTIRLRDDQLSDLRTPPYSTGPDSLFIAYLASAELGCHLALGWPLPTHVLDLYVEFRCLTNGMRVPCGHSLLGALAWHGLPAMAAVEKEEMRQLILSGGPWTEAQWQSILGYCETDVDALAQLLPAMQPRLDLPRALLRGRYMRAVANMEQVGVPIDTVTLRLLRDFWEDIKHSLIVDVDRQYGVYEGSTFKVAKFAEWLIKQGIPWKRTPSGALGLDDDTFRAMAEAYPVISPLRELRKTLSKLRLNDLAVGQDGRNRTLLSPFASKTGRNAPSTTKFIFGNAAWLRGLIQPPPGRAAAYVDWSQQEFGIAAALSGDVRMQDAYRTGDPYLAFAKQARAVPDGATKATHGRARELYKTCALGVQFGMGPESLALRTGLPVIGARDLLRDHQRMYSVYWRWSDGAADAFALGGKLWTVLGWNLHNVGADGERTARNFPMQANGAEMMRLAAIYMTEAGLRVCAPVHDAFLIEADVPDIDAAAAMAQRCMARASAELLDGFTLRTDVAIFRHPERYCDPRGKDMWLRVMALLATRCVKQ